MPGPTQTTAAATGLLVVEVSGRGGWLRIGLKQRSPSRIKDYADDAALFTGRNAACIDSKTTISLC